jgi:hypothetical protein
VALFPKFLFIGCLGQPSLNKNSLWEKASNNNSLFASARDDSKKGCILKGHQNEKRHKKSKDGAPNSGK